VNNYGENKEFGQGVSTALRDALFPKNERGAGAYEALVALQGLYMYLSHLESHMTALTPASQALWDKDFSDAVAFSHKQISRQQAWVSLQIKTRSPQTLLVPAAPLPEISQRRNDWLKSLILYRRRCCHVYTETKY
jgi:hypothetical protein